jgi:hypothetical protein
MDPKSVCIVSLRLVSGCFGLFGEIKLRAIVIVFCRHIPSVLICHQERLGQSRV